MISQRGIRWRRARAVALSFTLLWLGAGRQAFTQANDWPRWLGPTGDGIYRGPAISESWEAELPAMFRRSVGEGFSAPVVQGELVILFHRVDDSERLEAFDRSTGERRWLQELPTGYRDDFGFDEGPRATPEIVAAPDGKRRVIAYGAEGMLRCVDFDNGRLVWSVDTRERFSPPKGFFGTAAGTLTIGDRVLVNVGGPAASIVAFGLDAGEPLWSVGEDEAGYSAPVQATIAGRTLALFLTREGLVVVDPMDGEIVHRKTWRSRSRSSVNAASPVVFGDQVFLSASYGTGAILLSLSGDDVSGAQTIWSSDDSLSNHYATSVRFGDTLFGFHGRQEYGQVLRAVSWGTGEPLWERRLSRAGTVLVLAPPEPAPARLLILGEDGRIWLADTGDSFEIVAESRILDPVVRAYPALADGRLYARNGETLIGLDLRSRASTGGAGRGSGGAEGGQTR